MLFPLVYSYDNVTVRIIHVATSIEYTKHLAKTFIYILDLFALSRPSSPRIIKTTAGGTVEEGCLLLQHVSFNH